jgi:hypothetical protein
MNLNRYCKVCLSKVEPTKIGFLQNPQYKFNQLPDWWDCPICKIPVNIAQTISQEKVREKKLKKLL